MILKIFKQIVITFAFGIGLSAHQTALAYDSGYYSDYGTTQNHPIILIRHALAPGFGDPADFNVRLRSTQRNLSSEGETQAKNIGKVLRGLGIINADVYSSQWFRCLETAELLGIAKVVEQPLLNSFFQNMSEEEERIAALTEWLEHYPLTQPVVLVTHQVVITGLTNVFPDSGEIVILKRNKDGFFVTKRITTSY